jgi:hypothetical protein
MTIHIEYTPAFNDYLCAQRLHAKRRVWTRINDFAARIGNPALGALILVLALLIAGPGVSWTGPYVFMIACGITLLAYPIYYRYRVKNCFKRTRIGDGGRTFDIDEHSLKLQEGHTRSECAWSAIQAIREDQNVLMLYIAPAKFILIPKRHCALQDINEVKRLYDASRTVISTV